MRTSTNKTKAMEMDWRHIRSVKISKVRVKIKLSMSLTMHHTMKNNKTDKRQR
jgi:hypothetical protein